MENNQVSEFEGLEVIDIKRVFFLLRRNLWLIITGLILGAGLTLGFSLAQTPIYAASTQVMVTRSSAQGSSSVDVTQSLDVWTISQTYVELLSQQWILDKVAEELGLEEEGIGSVSVSLSQDYAPLIYIEVEDSDPARAVLIANTLVKVLIDQNESMQSVRYASAEESLDLQIQKIEEQIQQTQAAVDQAKKDAYAVQVVETQEKIKNTQSVIETTNAEIARLSRIGSVEQAQFLLFDAQNRQVTLQVLLSEQTAQYQRLSDDLETNPLVQSDPAYAPAVQASMTELDKAIKNTREQIDALTQEINFLLPLTQPGAFVRAFQEKQETLTLQQALLNSYQETFTNLQISGKLATDTNEITTLESNLDLYQQIYLGLLNNRETIRLQRVQNMPNVVQANTAIATESPIRPRKTLNTLLGGIAGFILVLAFVLIRDFLDTTIKSREDVERAIGLPVLGYVLSLPMDAERDGPFVMHSPRAPAAEAFRSLRTNLEFIGVDKPIKSLLISSSEASEGKTVTAANLGVIMAQGGKNVLLVDADLRKPRLHQELGVPNRVGLSDLFRNRITIDEAIQSLNGLSLSVITSGGIPPNPAELLGSEKMAHILKELTMRFDIVIIDSSPTLVTDSQLISARVDGVLIVMRAGETQAETAKMTFEQYKRVNARMLGVVLNNLSTGSHYGYAPYANYKYYREEDLPTSSKPKFPFRLPWQREKKRPS
jgi:capsular exopolysaccharide synthesis family protein